MAAALVSVVMPVRNGAPFVEQAIRSVLDQSLTDLECIVVDDGSDDETPTILARLEGEDRRVRVLAQPPAGIAPALNRALSCASGRFVARMDADDLSVRHRLETLVGGLQSHPKVAVLGSAYVVVDRAGSPLRTVVLPTAPADIRRELATQNCMAHPTVMMRREAVASVGGYRSAFPYCEDYDLWVRLCARHDLMNLSEPLLLYREHPGQSLWSELRQRLLSEIGILHSARCRSAGERDFASHCERTTPAVLQDSGMSARALRSQMCERALIAGRQALGANHREGFAIALAIARAEGAMTSRWAPRYARLVLQARRVFQGD